MTIEAAPAHDYNPRAAWWAVAVTMAFQIISLIDRQIVAVLIPEIRADLGLTDFQISLVQGMAFALFYGAAGLLIGGLVDRYSRRAIMFGGVVIWSLAAAATGLSRHYGHLFMGRLLVGFGEGAISPASQSLLASLFPRHKLSTPMSCFTAAGVIGLALSYALGGMLLERFSHSPLGGPFAGLAPWRQVFLVTGLPGVVIAFLAFTLREPKRRFSEGAQPRTQWRDFLAYLTENKRLMMGVILGTALTASMVQAAMTWTPTYARRVLGTTPGEIGTMMSVAVAVGGIVGGIALGLLADRLFSRGVRDIAFRAMAAFNLVLPPLIAVAFLADSIVALMAAITVMMMTLGATYGLTLAAVQMVAPPDMRGRLGALAVLSSNVAGFALGPMAVGALTDFVFVDPGKIGLSIACYVIAIGPLAAWLIWSARNDFLRRIAVT